jgi:hypothetical protein
LRLDEGLGELPASLVGIDEEDASFPTRGNNLHALCKQWSEVFATVGQGAKLKVVKEGFQKGVNDLDYVRSCKYVSATFYSMTIKLADERKRNPKAE